MAQNEREIPVQWQTFACTFEQFLRMCHKPYPEIYENLELEAEAY